MSFESIEGITIAGQNIQRQALPLSVRSLELLPGTYTLSVVYEHLTQTTCWQAERSERCWATRNRGWWLPSSTFIPGTVAMEVEAGKAYVVTTTQDYWDMPNTPAGRRLSFPKSLNHSAKRTTFDPRPGDYPVIVLQNPSSTVIIRFDLRDTGIGPHLEGHTHHLLSFSHTPSFTTHHHA